MAKPSTQDDYIRTALRLPPELHASIHASAEKAGRSFNAEIIARLAAAEDVATQYVEISKQLADMRKLLKKAIDTKL